jgi:hypothetical protein
LPGVSSASDGDADVRDDDLGDRTGRTREAQVSTVVVVEGRRLLLRAAVVGGIGSRGREPARRGPAAQEPDYERDGHAAEPFGESTAESKGADR